MITLPSPEAAWPAAADPPAATGPAPLGPREVLDAVADIAATLHEDALWHDGKALWLGDHVEPFGSSHRVVHRPCGGSLYDGTAGIGWFLAHAAATRAVGAEAARDDALGAFRHALDAAVDGGPLGLYDGAAGVGWAVLDGGVALDDRIAEDGLALLLNAVTRSVDASLPDELIGGRAGVIVAALAGARLASERLARPQDADRLTDGAIALGRQLVASAIRTPAGWTWPNAFGEGDEPPLCGLGHGGSGPVLAAAHLAAATGEPAFAAAAANGARGERAWLRPNLGWPDLREFDRAALERGEQPVAPVLWCHGAGGIGLSRVRAARLLGDPALLADATIALQLAARDVPRLWQAQAGTYESNFSLCHGAAGLIELFTTAASELGERSWLGAAAGVVQAGLAARKAGVPWACGVRDGSDSPSLMLGLAGTGAALLRLAAPETTSSPLLVGPVPTGASLFE